MLAALGLGFFGLPDFFQIGRFLLELDDFFLDQGQAFLRRFIFFLAHGFTLNLQLDQTAIELVHHLGFGVDFNLDLGGGFVDQINRLVRQETVGDVAVAQLGRRHDGRIGDVHTVVDFVFFLQTAQDGDGGFHRRLADQDFLEATLQSGVLFDVLAVFIERGRPHTMQLASGQCGLEHVAGVHRALAFACAHHGVQFINEHDGLALIFGQFAEHGFQALFKFTAELSPRQQSSHVQRQDTLALEGVRHFTGHDALGQALDNGGLTHAGLTDEHRVVFGATLQDLDGSADFIVAANHRVQLADAGTFGQVDAVFLEGFTLPFGVGTAHGLTTPHGVDGRLQTLARKSIVLAQAPCFGLAVCQGQQKQFAGNECITSLDGFLFGRLQQFDQVRPHLHLVLARHLRQTCHGRLKGLQQTLDLNASTLQEGFGPFILFEHGHQHMRWLDVGMVTAQRQRLGIGQGFLKFGGQFVDTHECFSNVLKLGPFLAFSSAMICMEFA